MKRDWARLAEAISSARRERGWTQDELAEIAGVGRSTVQNLEGGYEYKTLPVSALRIERAFGWADDSIEDILNGGDPKPADPPVDAAPDKPPLPPARIRFAQGMPLRVADELSTGDVVDTVVLDLSDDSRGMKLIAVLKADDADDIDPEAYAESLERWVQAQRKLRGLPTSDASE